MSCKRSTGGGINGASQGAAVQACILRNKALRSRAEPQGRSAPTRRGEGRREALGERCCGRPALWAREVALRTPARALPPQPCGPGKGRQVECAGFGCAEPREVRRRDRSGAVRATLQGTHPARRGGRRLRLPFRARRHAGHALAVVLSIAPAARRHTLTTAHRQQRRSEREAEGGQQQDGQEFTQVSIETWQPDRCKEFVRSGKRAVCVRPYTGLQAKCHNLRGPP